ncbi:MAG: DNA polymerase III subunit alpha [Patescibacteria group bacterium]|nr:DNA polymerase III subunit alpha [Patescibacteria group bacterium]
MFTHLHVHSHYSLLDGLPKIPDLVRFAKKKGFLALGLTDHGAMHGAIEFYKTCRAEGVKPIIGLETYLAPRGLSVKEGRLEDKPFHLTLLAKNFTGYRNLMQLSTLAHIEGFYYRPRIDFESLRKHAEGLIVLSGCISSELSKTILAGNDAAAKNIATRYKITFGRNFYLEIQRQKIHNDPEFLNRREKLNQKLIDLGRELSIPLVATADCHYLKPEDAEAQDILVCVETGKTVEDTDRLDMRSTDLSLASAQTMEKLFADLPEVITNTQIIADAVNIEIPLRQWAFPHFPLPDGETYDHYLQAQAEKGLAAAYQNDFEDLRKTQPEVVKRLEYELDIISKKGYSSYFLVVADYTNWSRARGIIATTRGSAAGSLVAYALGVTTVNPLAYQLPFERFLNLERPLPPDIDMDFADSRRDEVLAYVTEKYGKDKVAQIVTFGSMLARAAVRDVGRVLGVPYSKCDKIAKLVPFGRQGFHMTIDEALKISPELKTAYNQDAETKKILNLSRQVEGVARHASVHAAGVVISPTPLTDYTPLRADTETGTITTQYDMHSVEDTGLVKMDFLGIRNLSILGLSVEIVKKTKGVNVDLNSLPLDDKKTFELLAEGKTTGLFQLGGEGMTKYLKELKPTKVQDIMAMVALFRPGPMESIPEFIRRKHNPKLVTYLDPKLEPILSASYGILAYQDDVLLIAVHIAGYTWQEADVLRKAMGKKITREMAEQKEKFIAGCMKNGLSSEKALKLWSWIEPFAAYGFGKAHAAAYGMVSYQTAYMKANFPVEYMAAVMTAESGNLDTIAEAVAECEQMGITVLPPDVNASHTTLFRSDDKTIRFGLSAIKNLGSDVEEKIISERKAGGKFSTLADFVTRTFVKNFNKKSWEALVKCGALDEFAERNQLLANTEMVLNLVRSYFKERDAAQDSLFGTSPASSLKLTLQPAAPATSREKLAWEKELLGLYVTSHPLEEYRQSLEVGETIAAAEKNPAERNLVVSGIITRLKTILTKKGEQMAFMQLEDLSGSIEVVIFPRAFESARALLEPDKIVKVTGKFQLRDEEPKILADKIEAIALDAEKPDFVPPSAEGTQGSGVEKRMTVKIPDNADPGVFMRLKSVFEKHPGPVRIALDIPSPHGPKKPVLTDFYIEVGEEVKVEIKKALNA